MVASIEPRTSKTLADSAHYETIATKADQTPVWVNYESQKLWSAHSKVITYCLRVDVGGGAR